MSVKSGIQPLRFTFIAGFLCLALSGCPIPIPVCENRAFVKPGINVTELMPVHKAVPDGSVLVFGRVYLRPLEGPGAIRVRLVRYERLLLSAETPYAAEEMRLDPDGRFNWILPEGRYVIQPLYFRHSYEGVRYHAVEEIFVSVEFTVSESPDPIYLGALDITLSPGFKIQAITIEDEEETARVGLPSWSFARDRPITVELMHHNPELPPLNVRHRQVCHRQNICLGIYTLYGPVCFNEDTLR